MTTSIDDQRTKELFKQAMIELLEEQKDLFYDLFSEAIEDALLVRAIQEGETSEPAEREAIYRILKGGS